MSSSRASTPAAFNARLAASAARSLVVSPVEIRRSDMPVRLLIHSSLVSTISDSWSLVTTLSGAYAPIPAILAFILCPCRILFLVSNILIFKLYCLCYVLEEDLSRGFSGFLFIQEWESPGPALLQQSFRPHRSDSAAGFSSSSP